MVGATAGFFALITDNGAQSQLVFLDDGDGTGSIDPALPMPIQDLLPQIRCTGRAVYANDLAASEWVQALPDGHACIGNILLAPLTIERKVAGLLGLANKAGGFSEHDVWSTAAFAELAAIALVNDRAVESLNTARNASAPSCRPTTMPSSRATPAARSCFGIMPRRGSSATRLLR